MPRYTAVAWTFVVAAAALAGVPNAHAQVYKCIQPGGRVLYSDVACQGGAIVDANGGAPSPAAVRQLAHDNAAFDRKMEARRNAEDMAAIHREQLDAQRAAAEAAQRIAEAGAPNPQYVDPGYGYFATPRVRPHARAHSAADRSKSRVPATASPLTASRNRSP